MTSEGDADNLPGAHVTFEVYQVAQVGVNHDDDGTFAVKSSRVSTHQIYKVRPHLWSPSLAESATGIQPGEGRDWIL